MSNIFKNMKTYWVFVVAVILCLIVQAGCELGLPAYTSDIVDTGIEQSGIRDCVPEVIRESTFQHLLLFLTEDEKQMVESSYTKIEKGNKEYQEKYPVLETQAVYLLNPEDEKIREELNSKIGVALLLMSQVKDMTAEELLQTFSGNDPQAMEENTGENTNASGKKKQKNEGQDSRTPGKEEASLDSMPPEMAAEIAGCEDAFEVLKLFRDQGVLSDEVLSQMQEKVMEQFGDLSDKMMTQIGIAAIRDEYEEMGIDLGKIQISYLKKVGIKMLGISVLMMFASIMAGFLSSRVGAAIGRDLRNRVFHKVVSFSNEDIHHFSTASLITRCTNDIQQVQMVSTMLLRMVLYAPVLGIGGVIKVVRTDTGLGWIIFLAVAMILVLIACLMVVAMPKFKIMQDLVDRLNLVSREILTGLSVIRAFGREKQEEKRFDMANQNLMKTQLFTNRVMTFMMPAMMFIMNGITLMIIWFGGKGIDAGNLQVGNMMAFISYTMMIVISFLMITMMSIMLPRAGVAADRIQEVIDVETELLDVKHPEKIKDGGKGVFQFEKVSFYYPNAKEAALSNLNFTMEPGKTTAIIGSTGCGKTTLVNLMMRFYDVTEGRITYDGTDIRKIAQKDLRDQIGYVPQKGVLFSGTIESNIKYADASISDKKMEEAAETAQASEFIEEKRLRYQSAISQGGTNVSGGQKQRLSIARAIAKNPKVYIFDDSFSALDYKTDAKLRAELAKQTKDRTVVIVAQRISTIRNAEQIIVLDEGTVAGIGTHEELLKNCSIYQEIAKSQMSEEELKGGSAS